MTYPGSRDTGDILATAALQGYDDPDPGTVTDPDSQSYVNPAEGVTPATDEGE